MRPRHATPGSPQEILNAASVCALLYTSSDSMTAFVDSLDFARQMDREDPLQHFRERFLFPEISGREAIYFCGNSLGLQPKSAEAYLRVELEDWARLGVEGHVQSRHPWLSYHRELAENSARLVGAATASEVVVMNTLSVNLNLLMVSFYRPEGKRRKILMEAQAFPSDQYAAEMQAKFHGLDPAEAVAELPLRKGEYTHRTEDILEYVEQNGEEIALLLLGGVNYYSGQFFELRAITAAARAKGITVGIDLAHAAGNVPLQLHEDGIDFAVWCSYKYLNSGPGGVSGVFVHERHGRRPELPRFAGWWGNEEKTRFLMQPGFVPQEGAPGWQMSNAQIFPMALHRASLDIFAEAGIDRLRAKSIRLTGYLEFLLDALESSDFEQITPRDPAQRGAQLSLRFKTNGRRYFDALTAAGIVADWREPDVIRVAPVPLYNRFEDVYQLASTLRQIARSEERSSS